jgi:hypothetical protein
MDIVEWYVSNNVCGERTKGLPLPDLAQTKTGIVDSV